MDANKLVRMANQIAANFYAGDDADKAAAAVADHLRRFWSSQMKREIVEFRKQQGEESGLSEVADKAIAELAAELESAA